MYVCLANTTTSRVSAACVRIEMSDTNEVFLQSWPTHDTCIVLYLLKITLTPLDSKSPELAAYQDVVEADRPLVTRK